jgi:hypothetical protein
MGIFTHVLAYTENDLDAAFVERHGAFMTASRGYGYYIWKPQVILQAMARTPVGGFVVYADAGCSLHKKGVPRLLQYVDAAANSTKGVMGFYLTHKDKEFTKMDTALAVMNSDNNQDILKALDDPQRVGGINVYHNTHEAAAFVQEWLNLCLKDNYRYVSDAPSRALNLPSFREHRHDQSIFSMLTKKYADGVTMISDETWHPDWDSFDWPIHAERRRC